MAINDDRIVGLNAKGFLVKQNPDGTAYDSDDTPDKFGIHNMTPDERKAVFGRLAPVAEALVVQKLVIDGKLANKERLIAVLLKQRWWFFVCGACVGFSIGYLISLLKLLRE